VEISCEFHAPASLLPGKETPLFIGRVVGGSQNRTGSWGEKKEFPVSARNRSQILRSSNPQPVLTDWLPSSYCKIMWQKEFHNIAHSALLSFMGNDDECWLSKLRPSDKWMDGHTDRWIFDVTERAAASNRKARMIYQHVSLFLNKDILEKRNYFKSNYA
jgi:hypothetical protein